MASTKAEGSRGSLGNGRNRAGRAIVRLACGLVLAVTLAACATTHRDHGYVPADDELAQLVVGKDTQETAGAKVGRPSASGLLNDTGWFYVQSRWQHRGAMPPVEIDRQVVALTFSESGTLTNVERFGMERGQIVPLSRRVTESSVKGMGVLAQLFSNFGRLNVGNMLAD